VGKPRLLLEAASSYRGDQEDRLTELLAVALHEHTGFCSSMLSVCGARWMPSQVEVSTQEDIPEGPARIDLIIRAKSEETGRSAVIFIESNYNPDRQPQPYWFDEQQAKREARALDAQPEMERHLVAVASDHDLASRDVPSQYEHKIRWRQIADLAYSSGGDHGWELKARRPDALASQRILLEFWSYLKGDTVGAIDGDDLLALGLERRANRRVEALLDRVADELGSYEADRRRPTWESHCYTDWSTPGGFPIRYIIGEPDRGSRPRSRGHEGAMYALLSWAEWEDTGLVGEPQLYAGCGFVAEASERDALAHTDWCEQVRRAGLMFLTDRDGIYVFDRRPASDISADTMTLTDQVTLVTEWVKDAVSRALDLPDPPDVSENALRRAARRAARRQP
jgi:hypothetical protein